MESVELNQELKLEELLKVCGQKTGERRCRSCVFPPKKKEDCGQECGVFKLLKKLEIKRKNQNGPA